jgi:hypothetical protein
LRGRARARERAPVRVRVCPCACACACARACAYACTCACVCVQMQVHVRAWMCVRACGLGGRVCWWHQALVRLSVRARARGTAIACSDLQIQHVTRPPPLAPPPPPPPRRRPAAAAAAGSSGGCRRGASMLPPSSPRQGVGGVEAVERRVRARAAPPRLLRISPSCSRCIRPVSRQRSHSLSPRLAVFSPYLSGLCLPHSAERGGQTKACRARAKAQTAQTRQNEPPLDNGQTPPEYWSKQTPVGHGAGSAGLRGDWPSRVSDRLARSKNCTKRVK